MSSTGHRRHIHRDVILSSILTFTILWLLKFVFVNTHYLDPMYQALSDFQFTDLYYSQYQKKHTQIDTNIVIVNIGNNDRMDLVKQLQVIKSYHPKIIGLDVTFSELKDDSLDAELKAELHKGTPVILTKNLIYEEGEEHAHGKHAGFTIEANNPFFEKQKDEGFGNFLAEEGQSVRYYVPFMQHNGERLEAFGTKVIQQFDTVAYNRILQRNNKTEVINYLTSGFPKIEVNHIDEDADLEILNNKIVLMGYLGPNLEEKVFEDNHVTPLNKSYGGRSMPDMYGVEIHANIISMALRNDYINEVPVWLAFIIAFLVCALHMYVFIHLYVEHHKWFHLGAKTFQLISFAFFVFLSIGIFHFFRLKLEPTYILAGVLLSCDALYFYEGLVEFLQDKFHFQSYFKRSHTHH